MDEDEHRCSTCGLPDGPDYGDPHECPPGFSGLSVMTVPDAAIEAAAKAWHENGPSPASWEAASDSWKHGGLLRMEKSLEAAMPAIREALAQEIEAGSYDPVLYRVAKALVADAARIVRGGS